MTDFDSFNLKTLIPLAVGSMLAASGCSPEASAARKYCKNFQDCEEDAFDDQFDSMGECVKLFKLQQKASNYAAEIENGPECSKAMQKMTSCYAKELSCDYYDEPGEWAQDVADECEDEFDDVADECDSYSYGGYGY